MIQAFRTGRKVGKSSPIPERFYGKSRGPIPDSRSGLKMDDSGAPLSEELGSSWLDTGF